MNSLKHVSGGSRVTVAILNYNGRELLEVVLPSLAVQEYEAFDTIVVDDCSGDDSIEYLRREWPEIRVIATGVHTVNVAAALNIAVKGCQTELIALLNNDMELDRHWLGELVNALDHDPEISSVCGKLLNYWRRGELDGAGDIFTRDGTAFRRGHGQLDNGQYDEDAFVFAPTAGAALYRMSALAAVGPFDESFVAYFEDVDWGLRAQLAGYRCRYVPGAVAYHMGSATTGGEKTAYYFLLHRRNLLAVLIKDPPVTFLLRHAPRIIWAQLLIALRSLRAGMLKTHLRALGSTVVHAPHWIRARRAIQRTRAISAPEFERLIREWSR